MEVKSRNKILVTYFRFILKCIPYIIAFCYIIFTAGCYFGIELNVLGYIASCSIFTWLFLYISSFTFKFCIYHRIPLYYILLNDLLNVVDIYIGLPMTTYSFFLLHIFILGICLGLFIYLKVKDYARIFKKRSS